MTWWTVVRFAHVLSAALWVGGQLTVSLVVLPLVRRSLDGGRRDGVMRAVGRRFGMFTGAVFLPVQLGTGVVLAWRKGVTWASLAEPGYGRVLAAKLVLFCAVMAAAGLHGWAVGAGRPALARASAVAALVGSVGVVLLAAALPAT
ncbi:hypothetical protein [Planomonospora parontospora]|uniref:hypothetical protein n=1 Tax=Planomonospora parontospora TaxID=58119 RepID=UPI0016713DD0|nr:hypothetical protein [Planomonospora parontospora]GGL46817.1 hypothetical protein GCM10014719_55170 [Planomonospora parontospora subsp. antibiotica]GII20114.1 hypothetical protein Ppa05_68400 [Planomonospora parontospora subsp. antibiotica]